MNGRKNLIKTDSIVLLHGSCLQLCMETLQLHLSRFLIIEIFCGVVIPLVPHTMYLDTIDKPKPCQHQKIDEFTLCLNKRELKKNMLEEKKQLFDNKFVWYFFSTNKLHYNSTSHAK